MILRRKRSSYAKAAEEERRSTGGQKAHEVQRDLDLLGNMPEVLDQRSIDACGLIFKKSILINYYY